MALYYGFFFSCNVSRDPCRVCFLYLNVGFHGTYRKAVTSVTKQAENGQGTQKLLSA